MQFKNIPGHKLLKSKLIASVTAEKVAQAILLLGPEGNGALSLALAYATYLNCTDKQRDDSCGQCSECTKAGKFIHPDIHYTYPVVTKKAGKPALSSDYIAVWRKSITENPYLNVNEWMEIIGAENKQSNITVDECKDIIRNQSLKAYEASYKVQIVWMAEYLRGAGNVLLKIIEEPPPRTVFILIVEQQEHVLSTILSRTQVIKVGKFLDEEVSSFLVEKYDLDQMEADSIGKLTEGNMNSAIQLAEGNGVVNKDLIVNWLRLISNLSAGSNRSLVVEITNLNDDFHALKRENQKIFLSYLLYYLREVLMLSVGRPSKLKGEEKVLGTELSNKLTIDEIDKMTEVINKMHYYVERNANPKILFFNSTLKMAKIISKKNLISQ